VWVTNDRLRGVEGKLVVTMRSFTGKQIWSNGLVATLQPNSSKKWHRVKKESYADYGKQTHYLHAELWVDGESVSENRFFFVEPKHLELPDAKIRTKLSGGKNNAYTLAISTNKFIKNVQIRIDGENVLLSDNYFDIDAGRSKTVTFTTSLSKTVLSRNISVRWLAL
jgi:beta-mannosidase